MLRSLWIRTRTGAALFASYVTFVAWWCSAGVATGVCAAVAGVFWWLSGE